MESEFQKIREDKIKNQRNIALLETTIYMTAIFILFGLGGKIADISTRQVSLLSIDGITKIFAMICLLILVAIIFVPGPIIVIRDIDAYFKNRR